MEEYNKRVLTLGQDPRPNGLTNPLPRAKGISINKNQRKELTYNLIGEWVSIGGAIAAGAIMTIGFFKKDNGLFLKGMIPCWLFIYSSYLYNKEFNSIFN